MAICGTRRLRATLSRWFVVVACCVVCLTAPLDLDTVFQVITSTFLLDEPQSPLSEEDDNDDEDELLCPDDKLGFQENVRQRHLSAHSQPPWCCDSPCGLHFHPARCLAIRPGGEHSLRNGCGAPLLC
jgi:hypothetical protein